EMVPCGPRPAQTVSIPWLVPSDTGDQLGLNPCDDPLSAIPGRISQGRRLWSRNIERRKPIIHVALARDLLPSHLDRTPETSYPWSVHLDRKESSMPPSKKELLLEPIPLTEPVPARPPWFGAPGVVALILGAVFGLLFGAIAGDLISMDSLGLHFPAG